MLNQSVVLAHATSNQEVGCSNPCTAISTPGNPLGEAWRDRGLFNALSTGLYGIYHASQVYDWRYARGLSFPYHRLNRFQSV